MQEYGHALRLPHDRISAGLTNLLALVELEPVEPLAFGGHLVQHVLGQDQPAHRLARLSPPAVFAAVDPQPLEAARLGERAPVGQDPAQGGAGLAGRECGRLVRGLAEGAGRVEEGIDVQVELCEKGGGGVRGREGRAGVRVGVGERDRARQEPADREQVGCREHQPKFAKQSKVSAIST